MRFEPKRILDLHLKLAPFLLVLAFCSSCDRGGAVVPGSTGNSSLSARSQHWIETFRRQKAKPSGVNIRVFLFKTDQADISCLGDSISIWNPAEEKEILRLSGPIKCRWDRDKDKWIISQSAQKKSAAAPDKYELVNAVIEFRPGPEGILALGKDKLIPYRGVLRCLSRRDDQFALVNVVDIEDYLLGVVGAEVYAYWHKPTLRAQSVASRTYALYQMRGNDEKDWDIGSNQASQMYGGLTKESSRVTQSVKETCGVVLAYGSKGKEKIFPTYYSAICGGHTQNAAPVFGQALEPLAGQGCRFCQSVAPTQRYRWPDVTIDKKKVSDRLIKRYPVLTTLKKIINISFVGTSDYGRAEKVKLTGSNGRHEYIRGEDFRLAISTAEKPLLSSWFTLVDAGDAWRFENGHGWGHGVGLCQYGSWQMARQGNNCVQILQHYYAGAVLVRAY